MSIPILYPRDNESDKWIAKFSETENLISGPGETFCKLMVWNSIVDFGAPRPGIVQDIGLRVYHIECEPEIGCQPHNHDTHEVFIIISGEWKLAWWTEEGERMVILKPNDVISVPPGIVRRYRNILPAPGKATGMMIVIQEGMDGVTEEVAVG